MAFRPAASPAVYRDFIGFDLVFSIRPAGIRIFALCRLDDRTTAAVYVLRGRRSWRPLPKEPLRRSCTTQLVGAIRQLADHWRPEEFEADTWSSSIKFAKYPFATYPAALHTSRLLCPCIEVFWPRNLTV